MTGDVNLGPPKEVHLKDMKTWLNDNHDVATPGQLGQTEGRDE